MELDAMVSLPIRMGILAAYLACLSALELHFRGQASTRWRDSFGLMGGALGGAVAGHLVLGAEFLFFYGGAVSPMETSDGFLCFVQAVDLGAMGGLVLGWLLMKTMPRRIPMPMESSPSCRKPQLLMP